MSIRMPKFTEYNLNPYREFSMGGVYCPYIPLTTINIRIMDEMAEEPLTMCEIGIDVSITSGDISVYSHTKIP